jgi:terminal uridylyltransferase
MSQPRGGYTTPGGSAAWRSQSQMPFDRFTTPTFDAGRRGRQSEGNPVEEDLSAQEQWLAREGSNLGNLGSLGLGFPDGGGRGRDTSARGLETPGGPFGAGRRSSSKFNHDDPGTGSISAPLSPHRLYAQLEMGKGPASGWPAYESRQGTPGVPNPSGGPSSYANINANASRSTSSSHVAPGSGAPPSRSGSSSNGSGNMNKQEAHGTRSSFQPFSPAIPSGNPSKLRHMNAEANSTTSFISPSTLLSPQPASATLPNQVDNLASDFGKMGVAPPGRGIENDQQAKARGGRTTPGWQSKAASPDLSRGST